MRKILLAILITFSITGFSQNWEDIIPNLVDKDWKEFDKDGYTDRNRADINKGLELFPMGNDFHDEFIKEMKELSPEIVTEVLFVLDKPDMEGEELLIHLLNNIRAFSEQEGLEYWSHNRNKMYPLIEESYFTDRIKGKELPDPVVTELPNRERSLYFQEDTTFGKNYYELITRVKGNTIWLKMTNLEKMKVFGLFSAIGSKEQKSHIILYPYGDKVIVYCQAQIMNEPKVKKVLTYKVNVPGSFKRRTDTIIKWFDKRIKK